MRRRTVSILLLAILATLVVVALESAGQTPPPASGTWEIYDDTVFTNTSLDIPGSVRIYSGGSLTLVNVDLTFEGTSFTEFRVDPGGRFSYDGGTIDYTGPFPPRFLMVADCDINGVDFPLTYGVWLYEYGAKVTNCTFQDTSSTAVIISPGLGSPTDGPIIVSDNRFTNIGYYAISCSISTNPGADVPVIIERNEIDGGCQYGAIVVTANTPSAIIHVKGNKITNVGQDGIRLDLNVNNLTLRLDGNTVRNVVGHGMMAVINTDTLDLRGIVDLGIEDVGASGLWFESTGEVLSDLSFINLSLRNAGEAAITLTNWNEVKLFGSTIDTTSTSFVLYHSTLDIYKTEHERGSAEVHHNDSRVSSWKELEMTCVWQNGLPVSRMKVDVLGPVEPPLMTALTDKDGHWGRKNYVDWRKTNDSYTISYQLTPVLVSAKGNITDGALNTSIDQVVTVTFNDTILPVVAVRYPAEDILQNTTAFQVNGTSSDTFSGVALVQISFDPNPDWDMKVWADATGTDAWYVRTLYLSEGEYTLYIRAFDRANMNGDQYTQVTVGRVVVDLTPPIIQVMDPDVRRLPVIVNTSTLTVQGWASPDVTEIMVQRTAVPMAGTAFQLEVSIVEGLNDIIITAVDGAGNTGRYSLPVVRDTVPPVITLTAPASGALLNTTSVLVAGLVDEQVLGDHIVINGASVTLSHGAFEFLLSNLDEGPNTLDVTAIDLAGNPASVSYDVVVDTLPPMLSIVSPNDGLTGGSVVSVEGTTEAGAQIHVQGVAVAYIGTSFAHTLDLSEGRNVIHVTAADEAGNVNTTMVVVDLDTLPPVLSLWGLVDGTLESEGPSAVVNGMTEPGVILWMDMNGTMVQVLVFPDGSFIQPITVDAAELSITMRAEDAAGNAAFAEVTVLRGEVTDPKISPTPSPVDPVVTAALVTSTTIVVVGVALTFEFTKYALVLMLLPMYARIKKHEVLDNKTRLAIHGLVVENPGMHYNEIIREFDLTNGVAAYHLDVLEREGFVRSIRDGTLRRFYSSTTKVPSSSKATPDQVRENILELVTNNPGINQKTIVDDQGIGRTLVGYHLKTLIDEGYIEAHKQGRFTVYSRTRKRWFRLN